MRTQDEIVARMREVQEYDMFGFKFEVLAQALDAEHLAEFVKDDADLSDINPWTAEQQEEAAKSYLDFAFGKARDHRGLSASRSVEKLAEHAWLMGRDDVVQAMEDAEYAMYGVPMLFAFAKGMGYPIPDDPSLERMSRGEQCRALDDPYYPCDEGCGY